MYLFVLAWKSKKSTSENANSEMKWSSSALTYELQEEEYKTKEGFIWHVYDSHLSQNSFNT